MSFPAPIAWIGGGIAAIILSRYFVVFVMLLIVGGLAYIYTPRLLGGFLDSAKGFLGKLGVLIDETNAEYQILPDKLDDATDAFTPTTLTTSTTVSTTSTTTLQANVNGTIIDLPAGGVTACDGISEPTEAVCVIGICPDGTFCEFQEGFMGVGSSCMCTEET